MKKNEFIDGYLAAIQFVAIGHHDSVISIDALRNSGFSEKELMDSQLKSGFQNEKMIPIIKDTFSKPKRF